MSIGTVQELWRYPVKSMQGERCAVLALGELGLAGDRGYAVIDAASGRTLTAKTVPELLFGTARTEGDVVVVVLPDGRSFAADDRDLTAALSSWIGRDCSLVAAGRAPETSYDMTFDPESDDAELVNIPIAAGTFFDLTALHAMTTTSLATMERANGRADWDVRRFRPNVVISAEVGDPDALASAVSSSPEPVAPGTAHVGYPEDGWVGATVEVGDDGAAFEVLMPAVRCAIPNRAQPGLDRDLAIFRTMNEFHGNHLGVYCVPAGDGAIAEGDPIRLRG